MRTLGLPPLPPAALLYTPDTEDAGLPRRFADMLDQRGFKVGGLYQERLADDSGAPLGLDLIEIGSGERIALSRPSRYQKTTGTCAVEDSSLTQSGQFIRDAVASKVDLLVIEKFSQRERRGQGLYDEILFALAECPAVLTAVAAYALEDWTKATGGMSELLAWNETAIWRWWGPHRLYRDLELGVTKGTAAQVVIGPNWTLVAGPDGCGLAPTPATGESHGATPPDTKRLIGQRLRDLAAKVHQTNPFEQAVGIAAVNASYNRYDLEGPDTDGLGLVDGAEEIPSVVGRFKGITDTDVRLIERAPGKDSYPSEVGERLLRSGPALISASTLIGGALPALLAARPLYTETVLVGPSTPLSERLLSYGPTALAGVVVTDLDGALRAVGEDGSDTDLRAVTRKVTLS